MIMTLGRIFQPNRRISRLELWGWGGAWLASFVLLWSLSRRGILPTPLEVLSAFPPMLEQGLLRHLLSSLYTSILALIWTTTLATVLCYGAVLPALRPVASLVGNLRFWGFAGVSVVFTLWFHGGRELKVSLLTFGMTGFFVASLQDELCAIPKDRYDYARSLGMNEWRVTWEVVILGTFDKLLDIVRQNAAMGWMLLTMVETLVRSEGGIGVLLANQSKHLQLASIALLQLVIFALGMLQDLALFGLKRWLCPWSSLKIEEVRHDRPL
jgi:NitT/TauT family transport system permease protein